jgi:hypothetical protein
MSARAKVRMSSRGCSSAVQGDEATTGDLGGAAGVHVDVGDDANRAGDEVDHWDALSPHDVVRLHHPRHPEVGDVVARAEEQVHVPDAHEQLDVLRPGEVKPRHPHQGRPPMSGQGIGGVVVVEGDILALERERSLLPQTRQGVAQGQ